MSMSTTTTMKLKEKKIHTVICAFGMSRLPLIMPMMCARVAPQTNRRKQCVILVLFLSFPSPFLSQFSKCLQRMRGKANEKIESNFTVKFYKQKAQNAIADARTHAHTNKIVKASEFTSLGCKLYCAVLRFDVQHHTKASEEYLCEYESFRNCWRQFCRQISLNSCLVLLVSSSEVGPTRRYFFTSRRCLVVWCMCVSLKATIENKKPKFHINIRAPP